MTDCPVPTAGGKPRRQASYKSSRNQPHPGIRYPREDRFMARFEYEVMEWIYNSQPYEWVLILMGVIVIGAICMRSSSNKSNF
jgi:hypothetical protein